MSDKDNLPPCHFSGTSDLELIMSFGEVPVADKLLDKPDTYNSTISKPLSLAFSPTSKLLQIVETLPAVYLYDLNYPYFSSMSESLLQHFKNSSDKLIAELQLSNKSSIIEIASNDGYMLQNFLIKGIPVLGIEPSGVQAGVAIKKNIPTLNTFFGFDLAEQLVNEGKSADLIIANNVLAHAENLNDFIKGMSSLLKKHGTAVLEVPYVVDMINKTEFDTIYHQHIYYFSLMSLVGVFRKYGLHVNKVEKINIHGGSLRVFVNHEHHPDDSVNRLLTNEEQAGIGQSTFYKRLNDDAVALRKELLEIINDIKSRSKSIVAYGAAAKGTMLLSFLGLDKSKIEYVVDRNPHKIGKYLPGSGLEIFPVEKIMDDMPANVLILAWNFADEIMQQLHQYRESGGRFIVPIPILRII